MRIFNSDKYFSEFCELDKEYISKQISRISDDEILNTNFEDLVQYYIDKFSLQLYEIFWGSKETK